ncbi:hypothetical protein BO78DRAFT_425429 [Aspergillus sclerotiicarbonarius CBS 121057]|uniref:Zn(2)-C6 fungal-type domain-containing protein n=1 Tax=Aspergillus sclerotiicarbonarius (strain CBS 121057 / IBT 28362) TaxID=1448318 RepID=A0A319ERB6_ASPSB|nr:hypothetical protein BO78DRAFT_425429 [Aspergillus sclerotiicarbonarius CBS 121057]
MSDTESVDPRQGGDAEPSGPEPACDECRIRKVKCDRESPLCSSCHKSGLICQYTQKGKRVNHTKKLVNDVQLLGNRLERIEEAVVRCLSVVTASNSPPNSSTSPYSPDTHRTDAEDSWNSSDNSEGSMTDGLSELYAGFPGSLAFGPSSMASLYAEAQAAGDQLASSLSPQGSPEEPGRWPPTHESSLRPQIAEASALFQRLATGGPMISEPEHDDGLPPCLPPRALLEVFLETYFTELSPLLPIYDRQSVLAAMQIQYGSTLDSPDPAWIVSFSSILLQTLEAKSTATKKTDMMARSTLEADLLFQLLLNTRRCYNNFERLLQPRVANVQALLSMALVALKYFRFTMFETVFAQACELAKSMGLHQSSSTADAKQCAECQKLFWSLFILDKHTSLVAGKPCLLPSYDCGIPLPPSTTGILLDDLFAARISLAHIEEDVFCSLYSAKAPQLSPNRLSRRAHKLVRRLNDWTLQHSRILYPPASTTTTAQQATELRYALCICRVLVQRRISTPESRQTRLEHARTGLRLLQELCESYHPGHSISGFTACESILLNYPIVLFLEVYIHLLTPDISTPTSNHTTITSDTNALVFFASRADCLAANGSATSYAATIRSITQLCSYIATSLLHPPTPTANTNTQLHHLTPAIQSQAQHQPNHPDPNLDPRWETPWSSTPNTHHPGRDLYTYGEWEMVPDSTPVDFEEMMDGYR